MVDEFIEKARAILWADLVKLAKKEDKNSLSAICGKVKEIEKLNKILKNREN